MDLKSNAVPADHRAVGSLPRSRPTGRRLPWVAALAVATGAAAAAWSQAADGVGAGQILDPLDPRLAGAAAAALAVGTLRLAWRRRTPGATPSAPAASSVPARAAYTVTTPVEHGPPYTVHFNHEVRTPITAILGYTEMLSAQEATPAERVDFLEAVVRNCQSLLRLANDTLAFARVESDDTAARAERVRLAELLDEPLLMTRAEASARNLTIAVRTEGRIPEHVSTDVFYARQILVHLARTAISLSPGGRIEIVTRNAEAGEGRGARLEIAVHDTNTALTPAIRLALFDPWHHGTQTHVDVLDGAGLRLAIARRLAEKLGGTVVPGPSTPSGGSYRLVLPCDAEVGTTWVEEADAAPRRKPDARTEQIYPLAGRVLVVEAVSELGWTLEAMVARRGVEIERCTAAADAWDRLAANADPTRPWSAVVVDLEDPNVEGVLLVQRLLLDESPIPIIGIGGADALPPACRDGLTILPKPARGFGLYGALRPHLRAA